MSALEQNAQNVIARFESLGDNCEFGFVQRQLGYEDGSLFRWTVSPFHPLVKSLNSSFEGMYQFEHLEPSAPDMVKDRLTGLAFHTKMYSKDGVFIASEEEWRKIYEDEISKITYLKEKFFKNLLNKARFFVFKSNNNINKADADALFAAMRKHGEAQFLCVRHDSAAMDVTVQRNEEGYWEGNIHRFAPYSRADDIAYEDWFRLIELVAAKSA